jgi:hypothetical protein
MANRCTPGFLAKMKSKLNRLNRTIKEFLHNDGYKNIGSMDPWVSLRQLEVSQIWGIDPVHIKKEHVANLVEGVKIMLSKLAPKLQQDSKEANFGPPSKRGKLSVVGQGGGSRTPAGGGGEDTNSRCSGGRNGGGGGGPVQGGGGDRGCGVPTNPPAGRGGGPGGNTQGRGGVSRFGGGGGGRGWRGGRYGRMA